LYILYFISQARPRSTLLCFLSKKFTLALFNCYATIAFHYFNQPFSFPPDQKSLSGETGCKYSPYFNFSKKNCDIFFQKRLG